MNKKGQSAFFLLVGLAIVFILIIIIIVIGFVSVNINSTLDKNITLGQVNLKTVNNETFSQFNTMIVDHADFWGICIIFGMVIGLWAGAYFTRNSFPKLGVIIDIGFIFLAFIFSLYLKSAYSSVVSALSSAGQTFAETSLSGTNFFILNLPIFIPIVGVVMMVLFHSGIPQKPDELNVGVSEVAAP